MLDVGCGGGILSESLAMKGAEVLGIDPVREHIHVAEQHRNQQKGEWTQRLTYRAITAEELLEEIQREEGRRREGVSSLLFDVVCSCEVLEHVMNPLSLCHTLSNILTPSGTLILSTLNRTYISFIGAIVFAEYIARIVPKGMHNWNEFIKPGELKAMVESSIYMRQGEGEGKRGKTRSMKEEKEKIGMIVDNIQGVVLNPLNLQWSLSERNRFINYIIAAKRPF